MEVHLYQKLSLGFDSAEMYDICMKKSMKYVNICKEL